ncbi:ATP-binding protein [Paracoccus sp. 11-3]|uniref:ATP-binding protein n=1 Tax=Paracoccus amoyensis TaxID=2760093 RepID=A0A926GBN9_9RHOB|nr:ATP-binding protein [Paracoccus amoyensis]MBC9246135.1 ATP-binding protein [Paracoccus amoyensis]
MIPHDRQKAGLGGRPSLQMQKMFHRVMQADPMAVRQALIDIRARFGDDVSHDTIGRLELVLAEVMNNITEHTAPSRTDGLRRSASMIHLSIVRDSTGLACAVSDDGQSLPEDCLRPRTLPEAAHPDMPEGGYGWFLIQDLTQALCYYREGSRNFLAFNIPFAA